MPTQTLAIPTNLNVLGEYGSAISIRYDEINRDFGGGYDETQLTGPTAGTLFLRLRYGFLPTTTALTVIDTENGSAVTPWATYIWLFFKRRKADQAAFNVDYTDPATDAGATTTFRFVDSQLDYETVDFRLYSTGILLRQFVALA